MRNVQEREKKHNLVSPMSPLQMSGGCELVVVLLDFTSGGAGELSVRCGQTVELVERCAERPGWCLARTTDQTPQQVPQPLSRQAKYRCYNSKLC